MNNKLKNFAFLAVSSCAVLMLTSCLSTATKPSALPMDVPKSSSSITEAAPIAVPPAVEPGANESKAYSGQLLVDGQELCYSEVIEKNTQSDGLYRIRVSLSSLMSGQPFQDIQIECPDWFMLSTVRDGLQCIDVNADGYNDLVIDMGLDGRAMAASCFLYNSGTSQYELLQDFERLCSPEVIVGENLILSHWTGGPDVNGVDKYTIKKETIELLGRLTRTYDFYTGASLYKEQAMMDGHLETIHENATSSQIASFESWNIWDP